MQDTTEAFIVRTTRLMSDYIKEGYINRNNEPGMLPVIFATKDIAKELIQIVSQLPGNENVLFDIIPTYQKESKT